RFRYDASNRRTGKSTASEEVLYVGELYQRSTPAQGETIHRVRIPTPDGYLVEAELSAAGEHEYRYLQQDHLGSIVGVFDSQQRLESRSYGAFGEGSIESSHSRWGFTGHETDGALGNLVN